jgi:hypothetical protein
MRNDPPCFLKVAREQARLRRLYEAGLASGPATPDTAEDHEELVRLARDASAGHTRLSGDGIRANTKGAVDEGP